MAAPLGQRRGDRDHPPARGVDPRRRPRQ